MPAKELPADTQKAAKVYDVNTGKELHGWKSKLLTNENGGIKTRSLINTETFVLNDPELKGVLVYDDFAERILKTRDMPKLHLSAGFWADDDGPIVRAHLERAYGLLFSKDLLNDAVIVAAKAHTVNPVKERIESQQWDGKARAEHYFIDYLGAEDSEYIRLLTRIWLSGAVSRVYDPGCKFEVVPILEGKQGIGKSTAARVLFPEKFSDTLQSLGGNKDDYQALRGNWVLEIAELSAMKKTDVDKMKSFVSAQVDDYRASYGQNSNAHPRKCVFIGTTNQRDYLKDATGERRFYPLKCGVNKAIKNIWQPDPNDILQILAEAKHWVDNGQEIYSKRLEILAGHYQQEAAVVDPMEDAINDYLAMKVPASWDQLSITAKHGYFQAMEDNGTVPNWLKAKVDMSLLEPLKKTSAIEILGAVFGQSVDRYLSRTANSEAKRIRLILDNMPGWTYKEQMTINGKRGRGYERE